MPDGAPRSVGRKTTTFRIPAAATLRGAIVLEDEKTPEALIGRFYPWAWVRLEKGDNNTFVAPYAETGERDTHEVDRVSLSFRRSGEFDLARRLRRRSLRLAIEDGSLRVRERTNEVLWGWLVFGAILFGGGGWMLVSLVHVVLGSAPVPGWTMPAWGWAVVGGTLAMFAAIMGLFVFIWWMDRPARSVREVEVTSDTVRVVRADPEPPIELPWSDLRRVKRGTHPVLVFGGGWRVRLPKLRLLGDVVRLIGEVHLHPERSPLRPRRVNVAAAELQLAWIIGRTSMPTGALCALAVMWIGPQAGLPATRLAWAMCLMGLGLPGTLALDAVLGIWYRPLLARAGRRQRRKARAAASPEPPGGPANGSPVSF